MGISKVDGGAATRGIEDALRVKGEDISPQALDSGLVRYSFETSQLARYENTIATQGVSQATIGGSSIYRRILAGPSGSLYATLTPLYVTRNQNVRWTAMNAQITYDAAGLAADVAAGISLRFAAAVLSPNNAVLHYLRVVTIDIIATRLEYNVDVLLGRDLVVPWDWSTLILVSRNIAGNFPANTSALTGALAELLGRGIAF